MVVRENSRGRKREALWPPFSLYLFWSRSSLLLFVCVGVAFVSLGLLGRSVLSLGLLSGSVLSGSLLLLSLRLRLGLGGLLGGLLGLLGLFLSLIHI